VGGTVNPVNRPPLIFQRRVGIARHRQVYGGVPTDARREMSPGRYGFLPGAAILVATVLKDEGLDPLLAQGAEAILPIEQASRQIQARGVSFRSQ
jgi:hypothetical protein